MSADYTETLEICIKYQKKQKKKKKEMDWVNKNLPWCVVWIWGH